MLSVAASATAAHLSRRRGSSEIADRDSERSIE